MLKRRPEIKQGKWEQHVEETYDIETRTAINWMDVAEFIPYGADLDMGWAILVQKAREIKAKRGSNRKGAHKNRTPGKSSRKQKEQARQVKQEQWGSSKLGRKLQTLERLAEQTDYQIREYKTYTTADVSKVRRIVDFLQKLLTDIQSKAKPAVKANAK